MLFPIGVAAGVGVLLAWAWRWTQADDDGPPAVTPDLEAAREARRVQVWTANHCYRCSTWLRDDGFDRAGNGRDLCMYCWAGEVNEIHAAIRKAIGSP